MNSNITPIDTTLNAKPVDISVMRHSLDAMRNEQVKADVAYMKTAYLPDTYEKFKRLNLTLGLEHQRLGEYSTRLIIDISATIDELRVWNAKLNTPGNPDELEDAKLSLTRIFAKMLKTASAEARKLHSGRDAIGEIFDGRQAQDFLTSLEVDIARLAVSRSEQDAQLVILDGKRTVLSEAIDALESTGFATVAKETLLTGEKILALGLQPPQIALITLAIEQLKATVDGAVVGFNFLSLVKQRDTLRIRINKLNQEKVETGREQLSLTQRTQLIGHFNSMREFRSNYLQQYKNVLQTVENFISCNQLPGADEGERSRRFVSSGLQLIGYLQPLQ